MSIPGLLVQLVPDLSAAQWIDLAVKGLVAAGVVPAMRRFLSVGRRAKTASIVAQLAQEVLVAVARRKGMAADEVAGLEEAVEELRRRLIGAGVDPNKARVIAEQALAGAHDPHEAERMALARMAARRSLEAGSKKE